MDSTDSAYSALDAIDTVAFKIGVRGYNVDEVDDFLERLSGEVHQLKELVAQQRQQLRQAGERINQLDTRSSDAPAAAGTREKVFGELASDGVLIGANHLAFPALGRLRSAGQSWQWVPVNYSTQLR